MNPDIAQIALKFLERVDLKGAEVEAFTAVVQGLQEVIRPNNRAQEAPYEEA